MNFQKPEPTNESDVASSIKIDPPLSSSSSPEKKKKKMASAVSSSSLDWCNIKGKLYEKGGQIEQLRLAYQRQTKQPAAFTEEASFASHHHHHHHSNELVLITGPSGVGKSALAMTLQEQVEQDGGYFIRGKFDQPTLYHHPFETNKTSSSSSAAASSAAAACVKVDSAHGPFATALTQWASLVVHHSTTTTPSSIRTNNNPRLLSLRTALERELDTCELQVLAESIPALSPILYYHRPHHHYHHLPHPATTTTTNANNNNHHHWRGLQGPDAEMRYNFIFSKFVRAICSSMEHPLVLVLDDLQWADQRSMDLLTTLLLTTTMTTITTTSGLLIIGTVRWDEPSSSGSSLSSCSSSSLLLTKTLEELQQKHVTVTQIPVSNMSLESVHELVSDLWHGSGVESVTSLATTLYQRTQGNAFFMFQWLKVFEERGRLVHNNNIIHHWGDGGLLDDHDPFSHNDQVDDDDDDDNENNNTTSKIAASPTMSIFSPSSSSSSSSSSFSVLDLVANKIQQLPQNVQEVLKMASCFGATVLERLLTEAGSVGLSALAVPPALVMASEQGLVVYEPSTLCTTTGGTVTFVHDVIQQAAYSLISDPDRAAMHLHIGRALWIWLKRDELDLHLFLVTNQITRGLHLLDDQVEKEDLAELFLRAGHKAALSSAFSQASSYYNIGIGLLGRRHWKSHYRLSLALYNAAAEMEYYRGNLTQVDKLLNSVLKHAKSLDDKLHAYYTQIYSQSSRDDMKQAFSIGLDVLKQLGVTFPETLCAIRTRLAWAKCRTKLGKISDDAIMKLPVMQDNRQLMVMRLLNTLMLSAFSARYELVVPMVMRMVHHTLQYGICGASCIGFGHLGYHLGRRGHTEEGYRFVRLGLRIMERFDAKEWQSRLALGVYGGFYTMRHPVREAIKPLLAAHRAGLVVGDIHSSLVCASFQCRVSLCASVPLPDLIDDIRKYRRICMQYSQNSADMILSHQEQFCLNFMGRAQDPITLTGEVINEEETMRALQGKHPVSLAWLLLMKHMLAVYFNAPEEARKIATHFRMLRVDAVLQISQVTLLFLEGMAAAMLSSTGKNEKLQAQRICKQVSSHLSSSSENFTNKVCLLEAEIAAANGDERVALSKYRESIAAAKREGFLHEQALACERAGYALLKWGRIAEGHEFLKQACSLYEHWGALAKVVQVQQYIHNSLH